MKNYLVLFFILVLSNTVFSQNLIPNGDFELYNCLPTDISQTNCLKYWLNPTKATPDYYNIYASGGAKSPKTHSATIYPYSGNGFAGLIITSSKEEDHSWREYLTTPLITPLEIGETYLLSFAISNGVSSKDVWSSSNFNISFTEQCWFNSMTTSIIWDSPSFQPTEKVPQLTVPGSPWNTDWQIINLEYTPDRNYNYLMFGNLFYKIQTIKQVPNANTGDDSLSYYFIDKVSLTKITPNQISSILEMPNVFSPNNDASNDLFVPVKYKNLKNVKFFITNRWGNIVFETEDLSIGWDGKCKDEECDEGVYFWNIQYNDSNSKDINKHGYLTLIR